MKSIFLTPTVKHEQPILTTLLLSALFLKKQNHEKFAKISKTIFSSIMVRFHFFLMKSMKPTFFLFVSVAVTLIPMRRAKC